MDRPAKLNFIKNIFYVFETLPSAVLVEYLGKYSQIRLDHHWKNQENNTRIILTGYIYSHHKPYRVWMTFQWQSQKLRIETGLLLTNQIKK